MGKKLFKARIDDMQSVYDFVHTYISSEANSSEVNKLDLAVEEIFVNIAHYAYLSDGGDVEVDCVTDEEGFLCVTFTDSGRAYDPLLREDPDITLSVEERAIGGLGIFLTKQFMDEVNYQYLDGKNVLKIRKRL
ncbi:ATP-binding protein [Treponema sp.]|uniref:ATP-binding protein n=1 Tax=Treponema sp. TaxID=166 RepID=UPI0025E5474E|nr:ATP-binding protein [Treponema sp.]MCR5218105.1 ATP-binding protein [Treponema sp.]